MVDFVIRDDYPFILEMTPRPGGDSIPDLVEVATGVDLLTFHTDISSNHYSAPRDIPVPSEPFASINLFARNEGVITGMDVSRIHALPNVRSVRLKKNVGDKVFLPPADYDNRIIGHCIVRLDPQMDLLSTYHHLHELLQVNMAD
jgi:hypothetical protein